MKNILFVPMICLLFMACNLNGQSKQVLPANEFQQQLGSDKQLLDVRTTGEFNSGHIANAMQADWNNKEQFKDRVQYLDKNKPVLIYCQVGGRSAAAAKYLRDNGFKDVEELQGGLIAWKQAGKPVDGMPNIPEMTADQYKMQTTSGKLVLIEFGAEWCPPCKKMEPIIAEIQTEMKNVFILAKIDGGLNTNLMTSLNIDNIPAFIVYKNGKEVWRKQGVVEKSELVKILQTYDTDF